MIYCVPTTTKICGLSHYKWLHFRMMLNRQKSLTLTCAGLILIGLLLVVYDNYSVTAEVLPSSAEHDKHVTNWLNLANSNMQFSVVIDAGSSGSRVFIYMWPPHSGDPKELLDIRPLCERNGEPSMKKIEPGLSSISMNPDKADEYMKPLLDFAAERVPKVKHKETPLYILATAGLRLLSDKIRADIIEDLRGDIGKQFQFQFNEHNIEVISGGQEGTYQWMAINYILGRFLNDDSGPLVAVDDPSVRTAVIPGEQPKLVFRRRTVGILDMGGASMQIATEITSSNQLVSKESAKPFVTEFDLGFGDGSKLHSYKIYVKTFLGIGANEARKSYEALLMANNSKLGLGLSPAKPILDPCLPVGLTRAFKYIKGKVLLGVHHFIGTGNFDKCAENLKDVLYNISSCPGENCSMGNLPFQVDKSEFYGFSEFWYSMDDVLKLGGKYDYSKFYPAAREFCGTHWSKLETKFKSNVYHDADINRMMFQCFKSAWLVQVLHIGLGFPKTSETNLRSSPNSVGKKVTHWTLGAVLYRTRFLPLQVLQQHGIQVSQNKWTIVSYYILNQYALIMCFALVIASIVLYVKRLRRMRLSSIGSFDGSPTHSPFRVNRRFRYDSDDFKMLIEDDSYR